MRDIGRNITRLIRERKTTLPKLATKADMDKGNLHGIVKDGTGYSAASLGRIAEALDVPIAALFAEEGATETLPPGLIKIPVLSSVHAGAFADVDAGFSDATEFIMVSAEYSRKTYALRVSGDSMIPDFYPGNLVVVDPKAPVRPGRFVVAVDASGEGTLKKYASRGDDKNGREVFELIPSNPVYARLRSDRQQLRIIGVVRERIEKLA
jgi:SOS-response transcriptional repressor LexA